MPRFGIGAKLLAFSAIIFAGYAFLAGLASHKIHQTITAERAEMVRALDQTAVSMVKAAYARAQSGEMTEDAPRRWSRTRSGPCGTLTANIITCMILKASPSSMGPGPNAEGKNFYASVDPSGKQFVKEQIDSARAGTGLIYVQFPRTGSDVPVPKMSFVTAFDPWHWVIGTGVYIDDIDARFTEVAWQFFSIAVVVGLFMMHALMVVAQDHQTARPSGPVYRAAAVRGATSEFTRDLRLKDEIGTVARALQVFKEKSAEAERLRGEVDIQKNEAEASRRQALAGMVTTVETETDTAVTGIDSRMTAMTEAAAVMSRSAGLVGTSSQDCCCGLGAGLGQRADGCERHRGIVGFDSRDQCPGQQCNQSHGGCRQPQRPCPDHHRVLSQRPLRG